MEAVFLRFRKYLESANSVTFSAGYISTKSNLRKKGTRYERGLISPLATENHWRSHQRDKTLELWS